MDTAVLTLTVDGVDPGFPPATTVNAYMISAANAAWTNNQNAVSWDNIDQYAAPTPWVGGAGLGTPGGGGFSATAMGVFSYGGEVPGDTISFALDPAGVQAWIDVPEANAGMLLYSPGLSNWIVFESSESPAGEPMLSLSGPVRLIPEPSVLSGLLLGLLLLLRAGRHFSANAPKRTFP